MEILRGLPNFRWATQADVMRIVEQGSGGERRRFEVEEGRIRARYGHSIDQPIAYEPVAPPQVLYHGTSPERVASIFQEGLKPMTRQYVHLSSSPQTASQVGTRHAREPLILTILASEAHASGIEFYQADETVFLAKSVPAEFIAAQSGQETPATQNNEFGS
jgi:putative RNA 2'-phosphotransferase